MRATRLAATRARAMGTGHWRRVPWAYRFRIETNSSYNLDVTFGPNLKKRLSIPLCRPNATQNRLLVYCACIAQSN